MENIGQTVNMTKKYHGIQRLAKAPSGDFTIFYN